MVAITVEIISVQRVDVILQSHRRLITAILTPVMSSVAMTRLNSPAIIVLNTLVTRAVVHTTKRTIPNIVLRIRATARFAMS